MLMEISGDDKESEMNNGNYVFDDPPAKLHMYRGAPNFQPQRFDIFFFAVCK